MKRITAAAATALLGLSANAAQAIDPQLVGSDTLEAFMANLLADPGFFTGGITSYGPVGSGGGENAIDADQQEIAPMSRYLSTTGTAGCNDPQADLNRAGCWEIARDAITIVGNSTGTASCDALTVGTNWQKVLRLVYAGMGDTNSTDPIATRCNSAERTTLVNSWTNLFNGCSNGQCATGLKHAFRRDDQSGTTAVFLSLLGLPAIGTTPFCNGTEEQDADPVRRVVAGNGFAATDETLIGIGPTPNVRNADGTIGARDGSGNSTLGLVVTSLIPPNNFVEANASRSCNLTATVPGAFGYVTWAPQDQIKYGNKCPTGQSTVFNKCLWPKPPASVSTEFGCIASKATKPSSGVPSTFDGRIFNAWAKNADGTTKTYVRGATNKVANFVGSKWRQRQCRNTDETSQIGCFAGADACTIGFAGYRSTQQANAVALKVNNQLPSPDGVSLTAGYVLSRPLYVCQIDGFGSTPGTQSAGFLADQQKIYDELTAGTIAGSHISAAVSNPVGEFFPPTTAVYTKTCCRNNTQVTGTAACP
jgi:ABC-type phosphate transport system substrate-binding protein